MCPSLDNSLTHHDYSANGDIENGTCRPTHHKDKDGFMVNSDKVSDGIGLVETNPVLQDMRKQFEMQMTISTFSATLIVAFHSLVKALLIENARNSKLFNAGLLVFFFTMSCHIFIIAISGRSAFLSSDSHFTREYDIEFFRFALWTCEQLYMIAIYAFSASLLMMSFVVFENVAYPAAYCSIVAFGIVILFASRLRYLLVLYQSISRLKRLVAS